MAISLLPTFTEIVSLTASKGLSFTLMLTVAVACTPSESTKV